MPPEDGIVVEKRMGIGWYRLKGGIVSELGSMLYTDVTSESVTVDVEKDNVCLECFAHISFHRTDTAPIASSPPSEESNSLDPWKPS